MANLPENSSYSPDVFKNLSNFKPQVTNFSSGSNSQSTEPAKRYSKISERNSNPNMAADVPKIDYNTLSTYGQPLAGPANALPTPATVAPADYTDWVTGSNVPAGEKPETIAPGTRFGNISAALGGGQYALPPAGTPDTTTTNLKSYRQNATDRAEFIPGIGTNMQIDHIVPLWLDGTNTDANKEVLDYKTHYQKTQAQEVVRALFKDKIISKNEAKVMSLNWENIPGVKDVDLTPVVASNGMQTIDINKAKDILNQYRNPSTDLGFWGSLQGIKDNWGDAVKKVQGAAEDVGTKVMPAPLWNFTKGLTEGYTGGWISGGQTSDAAYDNSPIVKDIGTASRWVGSTLGTIAAFMTLTGIMEKGAEALAGRGALALGEEASTAGKINSLGGLLSGETVGNTLLTKAGEASPLMQKIGTIGTRILGTTGLKTAVGATTEAAGAVGAATSAAETAGQSAIKLIAAEKFWAPVLRDAFVFNVYGQLSKQTDGESRLHRAYSDTIAALAMNVVPKTKFKYAVLPAMLGGWATYISTGDLGAGVKTGMMYGGLFAAGVYSNNTSFVSTALRTASETANEHISSITGRPMPAIPMAGASEAELVIYKATVQKEANIAEDILARQAENGNPKAGQKGQTAQVDIHNFNNEIGRIKASNQILQGNVEVQRLGTVAFEKTAIKDWAALNKTDNFGSQVELPEITRRTPYETTEYLKQNPDVVGLAEAKQIPKAGTQASRDAGIEDMQPQNFSKIQATGLSSNISPYIAQNVKDFNEAVSKGDIPNEAFVSRNREAKYVLNKINSQVSTADIKAGKTQLYNPDNAAVVWYFDKNTKEIKILGMLPTESRIGEVITGPNGEIKIKGNIDSQNAAIAAENAGKPIEQQRAYLDHTENNDAFVKEMEKNSVQVVRVRTEMPQDYGNGLNIGKISNQPYFHLSTTDDMWREAKFRNKDVPSTQTEYLTRNALKEFQDRLKTSTPATASELPIGITDQEINDKFAHLLDVKGLEISPNAPELTPAQKYKLMEKHYEINTPKIANTIKMINDGKIKPEKPPVLPPKGPQNGPPTPPQGNLPIAEIKPATIKPQEPQIGVNKVAEVPIQQNIVEKPLTAPKIELATAKEPIKVKPKDYSQYDSETKINRGVNSLIEPRYQELYNSGDKQAALALRQDASKNFSREGDRLRAQNALEKSGSTDEYSGWKNYREDTLNKLKELTGNDKIDFNPDEESVLHRQYNRLLQGHTRQSIYISAKDNVVKLAPAKADLMGQADQTIMKFNKDHNLPKDAMEIVGVDNKSTFTNQYKVKMSPVDRIYRINNDLKSVPDANGKATEFIPIGKTAKGEATTLAVKYEPELVKMYNEETHGGTNLSDRDKFLRVFAQDVLGLPKETTADDVIKRSPLIFQRYERYMGDHPNEQVPIQILKSRTIKEAGGLDESQFPADNPTSAQAKKIYGDAKEFDGKLILGENLFDHLNESYNLGKNKNAIKPILQGMVQVGDDPQNLQYMIQKGHAIRADQATRDYLKKYYNTTVDPNGGISFDANVKIGPEEGAVKIPLKNFFLKNIEYNNESSVGPSFYSKFTAADKIMPDVLRIDKENIANLNDLTEKLAKSKNKADMDQAFADFKDKTGIDASNFTFGAKEKIYNNGAGVKRFSQDLKKTIKNLALDTVYSPKVEDSKQLYLTPSIELKLDGPNKPARFLNSDEVAIGKKFADASGIKDGEQVIVKREPANHISDYVYAKARIGDPMGATSLGDEHIMLSSHNTYVKVKGDHDGDAVAVYKVGGKYMPETISKAIQNRGQEIIPIKEASKRAKAPLTSDNLLKVMSSQLVGDDQTGAVASMGRVVNLMKDNNAVIKIEAASPGVKKSNYEILIPNSEGKGTVVAKGTTLKSDKTIYAKVDWNNNTDQLKQQISQYALDSKSSDDIIKSTATKEYPQGGDPLYMAKNAFLIKDENGNILYKNKSDVPSRSIRSITDALRPYQEIFNMASDNQTSDLKSLAGGQQSVMSRLKPSIDLAENIKKNGGILHPTQERLLQLKDLKDLNINEEDYLLADIHGRKATIEQLGSKIKDMSPAAKAVVKTATDARQEYNNVYRTVPEADRVAARKAIRQKVVDLYDKSLESGKLTDSDVDALAYWTVTSPDGDIAWSPNWNRKYVHRYDEMIGNSPAVSNAYYKAYEEAPLAREYKPNESGLSQEDLKGIALQSLATK